MKSSFKYVIVLVILSLSGLFIYQLFWITGLYHSRQKQNQEEIRMAIKNADHIELFNRADFLSRVTHRQRETSAIADMKGGAALSTRFPDKDSVIPELSVQPLDTNIYHPRYRSQTLRNEAGKMLKSTAVEVGNDFRSLGELGLQMQQALHEVIDSVKPVDLAKFDSILSSHLQKRGLDIRHHTEMWNRKTVRSSPHPFRQTWTRQNTTYTNGNTRPIIKGLIWFIPNQPGGIRSG